jgi:hypothetical protein
LAPADRRTLADALAQVRRRWLQLVALTVAPRALVAAAVAIGAAAAVDAIWRPGEGALLLLAVAVLLVIAGACLAVVWPYRRRPDDRRVARYVEERCPDLDDSLAAAVDVAERNSAAPFAPLVLARAAAALERLDPVGIVDPSAMHAAARRTMVALAALCLAGIFAVPLAERTAEVVLARVFPGSISIAVSPGNARVVTGRGFTVRARIESRGRRLTHVTPRIELVDRGAVREHPMAGAAAGYQADVARVERSFRYRVVAGGAISSEYEVTALVPPRLEAIDLRYEYPSFTHLPPRDERDAGDIYAPAGTPVRLRARADKPVASGTIAISGGNTVALSKVDARTFESTLTLDKDGAYRVALADADGLRADSVEYFIRLVTDRPPEIHLVRPAGDQRITPLEEVTIEARADDDYGVAHMDLVYSVAGGAEHVVPFSSLTGTETARVGTRIIAAEDLGVKPGDVISYYARARDVPHAKAPTLAHSEIFFLEVQPFNEEYSLADSQAMAAATGTELESLIAAQKEVISATWNLERRASAGRSAEDLKAVAAAQAQVKGRTERAAGADRPPGGIDRFFQQIRVSQPDQASGSDSVAAAAAAMGRAVSELNGGATKSAIPHEMAALNALLKAAAAVRQHQVAQQRNGPSSFGNGRQGQDLSTLFDRELKRQQRSSYESQSQVEQPAAKEDDQSALDRIRDLARRQEDLSARQKALAGQSTSDEERRRELEKLTREQEELRRELNDAMQRLGGSAASGQGAQQALRDALDEMRRATSELQRQQPGSAADRGEQAAERLRSAEGGARGGRPGSGGDAGDLRVESQQIADAQERIAAEADRMRKGAASSEAARRLADEKKRLAERIRGLSDAAQRLAASGTAPAPARSAAQEAARAIENGRLDQRMKQGAEALAGKGGVDAAAERQLADALDGVARRLSGADAPQASAETKKLADNLDALREARERLARARARVSELQQQEGRGRSAQPSTGKPGRTGGEGRSGTNGSQNGGEGGSLDRAREDYARELQRTRDLMNQLRGTPDSGKNMSTPEEHEWSRSAPGTEAWKQDFARWDSLAKDVDRSLEQLEGSVAGRLSKALAEDRLRAGGSERIPDAYAARVARYYESLAKVKQR